MTVNTLGTDSPESMSAAAGRASRTMAELLWPFLACGVSVFAISALVYYHLNLDAIEARSSLQVGIAFLYRTFGLAPSVLFFLLLATWSTIWFVTGELHRPAVRLARLLAMAVMLGVFLNLGDGGVVAAVHKGQLGAWLAERLVTAIGYVPSLLLVWATTFAALLLATDFFFSESFERLRRAPLEDGVEVAVTDHLRGLAAEARRPGAVPGGAALPTAPASAGGLPAFAGGLPAAVGERGDAPDAVGVHAADAASPADAASAAPTEEVAERRSSYAERRRARALRWASANDAEDDGSGDAQIAPGPVGASAAAEVAQPGAHAGRADAAAPSPAAASDGSPVAPPFAAEEPPAGDPGAQETADAHAADAAVARTTDSDDIDIDIDIDIDVDIDDAEAGLDEQDLAALFGAEALPVADLAEPATATEEPLARASGPLASGQPTDAEGLVDEALAESAASAPLGPAAANDGEPAEHAAAEEREHVLPDPESSPPPAATSEAIAEPTAESPAPESDEIESSAGEPPAETSPARSAAVADEPPVPIPRPAARPAAQPPTAPRAPRATPRESSPAARQQQLFGGAGDDLVQEAVEVVTGARRATAALLQRKLRIDYELARELLAELAARGIVALDGDASHGRVVDS